MGDVGDSDRKDMSARIVRIGIGRGVDRVVVVLGVDRIDGNQRQPAPVLAALEGRGLRRVSLGLGSDREHMRNIVRMDRDQADRALAFERAEPFLDASASAGRSCVLCTLTAIRSPS